MKRSYSKEMLGALVLLLTVLACMLPAAPTVETDSIETAISSTLQVAAQQTATAQRSVTKEPGMTGTAIELAEDATTKYTDYDAGFEVTFPAGWLVVRPKSEEFDAALAGEGAVNPMLHAQMESDLQETDDFRLFGYILRPDIKKHVLFGFSEIRWITDQPAMLDNANMGYFVRELETQTRLPGFHVDTAQIHDETHTRVIEVGGRWTLHNDKSELVPFYAIFYLFKPTQNTTIQIASAFPEEYGDELAADSRSIMDSIQIIEP